MKNFKDKSETIRRDDAEQSKLFIEAAREIGADKKSGADELLEKLAKTKADRKPNRSNDE